MQWYVIPLMLLACTAPAAEHFPIAETVADHSDNTPTTQHAQLLQKVDSVCKLLPAWLAKHHYNEELVLLADLSMHSGLPRMVLVDVATASIVDSGMVAHGAGGNAFAATARFSNIPNSYCSSLGKYRMGAAYKGNFGKAYKLHGLDASNNNAYQRLVVLHAYDCVPDSIPYPNIICNSLGCPMISYNFLNRLSKKIAASEKPMLLWIIN